MTTHRCVGLMNKITIYRKFVLTVIIFVSVTLSYERWSGYSHERDIQDQPVVIIHNTSHWVNKTTKTVLVWTEFFSHNTWVETFKDAFQQCKFKCVATSDKTDIKSADAVIFHLRDINSRPPDYRDKSQVWIVTNAEAPTHITLDYYFKQVNSMFNWTMSYRRDSTVKNYYGRFRRLTRDEQTKYIHTDYVTTKSKMAASIVSNCDDNADRKKILTELGRYVELDQYGNCGYLDCPKNVTGKSICTSSAYRYRIALENSICQDYITEKFWNSLKDNVIPVVNWPWIDDLVTKELVPPNSFINLYDFKSVADLGRYLNHLAGNYSEYNSYFEWKKQYRLWDLYRSSIDLCTELHQPRRDQEIPDLWKWLQNDTSACKRDPSGIWLYFEIDRLTLKSKCQQHFLSKAPRLQKGQIRHYVEGMKTNVSSTGPTYINSKLRVILPNGKENLPTSDQFIWYGKRYVDNVRDNIDEINWITKAQAQLS